MKPPSPSSLGDVSKALIKICWIAVLIWLPVLATAQIVSGGVYFIQARHSGKVMTIPDADGPTPVTQSANAGRSNQRWIFETAGDGWWTVRSLRNGLALSISECSADAGKNLITWQNDGGNCQKFKMERQPGGYYNMLVQQTGFALDVKEGSPADGANIMAWPLHNQGNQQWNLIPANKGPLVAGGVYTIQARHSGMAMTVPTVPSATPVTQSSNTNLRNQQWKLEPAGDGWWYVKSMQNGLVLALSECSGAQGAALITWENGQADCNKFQFVDNGQGYMEIFSQKSGMALDVNNASTAAGGGIVQWPMSGAKHQQWKVTAVPETVQEDGFRVLVNGLQCLQTGDGAQDRDEVYIDVYVDGQFVAKWGKRNMNEADRSLWEQFADDFAQLYEIAQQEYWLMPGSVFAKNEVVLEVWEEDDGRDDGDIWDGVTNNDDFVGKIVITKSEQDSNNWTYDMSGAGHYLLALTKYTRASYDARYEGISARIPVRVPILDQGSEGACVAFSVVAALTTVYLNRNEPGTSRQDLFDALALYGRRGFTESGWHIYKALEEISLRGIPFRNDPSRRLYIRDFYEYKKDGSCNRYYAQGGRIQTEVQPKAPNGPNAMRAELKQGNPLLVGYEVYPDFMAYAKVQGVYGGRISGEMRSRHAVMVVGYENPGAGGHDFPIWILQNSWGPDFGDNGLCKFAQNACGFDDVMYKIGELSFTAP